MTEENSAKKEEIDKSDISEKLKALSQKNPKKIHKPKGSISKKTFATSAKEAKEAREAKRAEAGKAAPAPKKKKGRFKKLAPKIVNKLKKTSHPKQKNVNEGEKKKEVAAKLQGIVKEKKQKVASQEGKKRGEKNKGRVYRSVQERSKFALVIGLLAFAVVAGLFFWTQSGAKGRLVDRFNLIEYPTEQSYRKTYSKNELLFEKKYKEALQRFNLKEFNINSFPDVAIAATHGINITDILIQKYTDQSSWGMKFGIIVCIGAIEDSKGTPVLRQAMLGDDKILADFACRSASQIGEFAISTLEEGLDKLTLQQQSYLVQAIAQTKSEEGLATLKKLSRGDNEQLAGVAVEKMLYYGAQKKVVEQLYELVSSDKPVIAKQAFEAIYDLQRKLLLDQNAHILEKNISKDFEKEENVATKALIVKLMGVLGITQKVGESGDYSSLYRDQLRQLLEDPAPEIVAAASYSLGLYKDTPSANKFFELLNSKNNSVVRNAAHAIGNLDDPDILEKILASKLYNTENQILLKALADILASYRLYVKRLGKEEAVQNFAQKTLNNAQPETLTYIKGKLSHYLKKESNPGDSEKSENS